ncbi:recombinase family protein [Shewanella sp. 202IG2-18]|uniref:recombinase family protein n=1 Tax=Parashewanella hymeniacidonis TaxID=2807618 RepID=UPI001961B3D3|nr:recombinase family protein [Parashewanella hymeniacidonis]MBM7071002.1 recombinase family protein [Parashewanella hymeniacidonis]
MKYIYSRVSTVEQNAEQQTEVLKKSYPDFNHVFEDKFSGKTLDRPELNKLLERVISGDTIIAYDVSRLGRNTLEVLQLVEMLQKKGVSVVIKTLDSVDITSPTGKLILTTMASIAEMQRTEMLEKQKIGIATAKAAGKYVGRKASPETIAKYEDVKRIVESKAMSVTKALKTVGLSRTQYYRFEKK